VTGASVIAGGTWLNSDEETTLSWSLRGGLDHQFSPTTRFVGDLGLSLSQGDAESGLGVVGGFTFEARPAEDMTFNISVSQRVDQDVDGGAVNIFSVGSGLRYDIDSRSRVGLRGSMRIETPLSDGDARNGADDEDEGVAIVLAPTYTRRITETVDLSVSYRLSLDEDRDFEPRNALVLQLSRNFWLSP
jgi:hypothetical protein